MLKVSSKLRTSPNGRSLVGLTCGPIVTVPEAWNVPGYGPVAGPSAVNVTVDVPAGSQFVVPDVVSVPCVSVIACRSSPSSDGPLTAARPVAPPLATQASARTRKDNRNNLCRAMQGLLGDELPRTCVSRVSTPPAQLST